jgi:hypothetical protein
MPALTVRQDDISLGSRNCPPKRRGSGPADPDQVAEAGTYQWVIHGVEQFAPELKPVVLDLT